MQSIRRFTHVINRNKRIKPCLKVGLCKRKFPLQPYIESPQKLPVGNRPSTSRKAGYVRLSSFTRVCETRISYQLYTWSNIFLKSFCQREAFENKPCALSFFTDVKMDVMRTMITVLFIVFQTLIKEQQALNLQGNDQHNCKISKQFQIIVVRTLILMKPPISLYYVFEVMLYEKSVLWCP